MGRVQKKQQKLITPSDKPSRARGKLLRNVVYGTLKQFIWEAGSMKKHRLTPEQLQKYQLAYDSYRKNEIDRKTDPDDLEKELGIKIIGNELVIPEEVPQLRKKYNEVKIRLIEDGKAWTEQIGWKDDMLAQKEQELINIKREMATKEDGWAKICHTWRTLSEGHKKAAEDKHAEIKQLNKTMRDLELNKPKDINNQDKAHIEEQDKIIRALQIEIEELEREKIEIWRTKTNENQVKISTLEQELGKLKIEIEEKDRITKILASNIEKQIEENKNTKEENKKLKNLCNELKEQLKQQQINQNIEPYIPEIVKIKTPW